MRKANCAACVSGIMPDHAHGPNVNSHVMPVEPGYVWGCLLDLSHVRRILIYVTLLEPAMVHPRGQDPKATALARDGVLNPHPEGVRDPLFNDNPFFDPKDLVQVRYEMVRRHQNDGIAISDVAETFGVSRPTFYKAQSALAGQGLAGLVPRPRGPKGGHKISAEVLSFVEEVKAATPSLTLPQVIGMIAERFGRRIHRRSLERALARKKK
jgi:transposase